MLCLRHNRANAYWSSASRVIVLLSSGYHRNASTTLSIEKRSPEFIDESKILPRPPERPHLTMS
jgi:hypothetical protein